MSDKETRPVHRFQLRMPKVLHEYLEGLSKARNESINTTVLECVAYAIGELSRANSGPDLSLYAGADLERDLAKLFHAGEQEDIDRRFARLEAVILELNDWKYDSSHW